jgi:hypothetical protein
MTEPSSIDAWRVLQALGSYQGGGPEIVQAKLVDQEAISEGKRVGLLALFDQNGNPLSFGSPEELNFVGAEDTVFLSGKVTGETYPRVNVKGNRIHIGAGNRAPFHGSHTVGTVGYGSDAQFYLEGLANVSTLFHIQSARPGSVASNLPSIVGTPTFPMTLGSVTVSDASEIPATDSGPNLLGNGFLQTPGFSDSFTRANSATTMGSPWAPISTNVWGINGNQAYNVSGDGVSNKVLYDTGADRNRMTVYMTAASSAEMHTHGVVFNYVDENNHCYIQYSHTYLTWSVYKKVAGVATFLFNSGSLSPYNQKLQAEYKGGIVYVTFGEDGVAQTSFQSLPVGQKCGFFAPAAGGVTSVRWDDFSIVTEHVATWTGKTGNTLTGFTCTTATGTADSTWAVRYADGTRRVLFRVSDSFGAPIKYIFDYGGEHTTDNITMGGGLSAQVGMAFLSTAGRRDASLILYGDAPVSGSGNDSNAGLFLGRIGAYQAALGGRLVIRPSDRTDTSGNVTAGVATDPDLCIGNVDTGLYLATAAPDTIGFSVDGVGAVTLASGALNPVASNTVSLGTSSFRWKEVNTQGNIAIHNSFGNSINMALISANPVGATLGYAGSVRFDYTNGDMWMKVVGANTNTGWYSPTCITFNRQSASYTLVLIDRTRLVEMNNASANNLTIPLNSTVAFPIGSIIQCAQYGAGLTTIVPTGGVTLRSRGGRLKSAGQYARWTLEKVGTDEWYVSGDVVV